MKVKPGGVLFHVRGKITHDEVGFYENLNLELKSLGFSLTIVGHHWPEKATLPYFRVPSGLQKVSLGQVSDSYEDEKIPNEEFYLNLDRAWRPQAAEGKDSYFHSRALNFFNGYYDILLKYVKPSLVIIWNGHHPQEKILAKEAIKCGCKLGFVERGPIPGTIQYDNFGVLGGAQFATNKDIVWGNDVDIESWCLKYDLIVKSLQGKSKTWWNQPKTYGKDLACKKLNIGKDKKIVLFAGQVDEDAQTIFYSPFFSSSLEALNWFCKKIGDVPGWQLLGKHHPQNHQSKAIYQNIVKECGIWSDKVSLEDALGISDRVVAVNSTVLYEAMMRGVPAMALGVGLFTGKNVMYEFNGDFNDLDQVRRFINGEDFIEKKEKFREMMAFLLYDQLYDFYGDLYRYEVNGPKRLAERIAIDLKTRVDYAISSESSMYLEVLRNLSSYAQEPSLAVCLGFLKKKARRSCRQLVKRG
ncbi:hypothetical protein [Desulfuromonas thiophila]|uniref:capsular polysaccharide export protein, LipB/KpsS family n=1 Tax=Desulfuromonas thiophila TaxID=57664 RepID=UPI0024A8E6AC|nr:hypothetical protein [Desulfuromonas thiophila]